MRSDRNSRHVQPRSCCDETFCVVAKRKRQMQNDAFGTPAALRGKFLSAGDRSERPISRLSRDNFQAFRTRGHVQFRQGSGATLEAGSGRNDAGCDLMPADAPCHRKLHAVRPVWLESFCRKEQTVTAMECSSAAGLRCCNASRKACPALPGPSWHFAAAVNSDISECWKIHFLCVASCRSLSCDLVTAFSAQSLLIFICARCRSRQASCNGGASEC